MAKDLDHIYENFIPDARAVADHIVDDGLNPTSKSVVKHETASTVTTKTKKKKAAEPSMFKNTINMRERRKDPEYRRHENEKRKAKERRIHEGARSAASKNSVTVNSVALHLRGERRVRNLY